MGLSCEEGKDPTWSLRGPALGGAAVSPTTPPCLKPQLKLYFCVLIHEPKMLEMQKRGRSAGERTPCRQRPRWKGILWMEKSIVLVSTFKAVANRARKGQRESKEVVRSFCQGMAGKLRQIKSLQGTQRMKQIPNSEEGSQWCTGSGGVPTSMSQVLSLWDSLWSLCDSPTTEQWIRGSAGLMTYHLWSPCHADSALTPGLTSREQGRWQRPWVSVSE